MKNKIFFGAIALATIVGTTSCGDSFLEEEANHKVTDALLETGEGAKAMAAGLYANIRWHFGYEWIIAIDRPNTQDCQQITAFGLQILEKLKRSDNLPFSIPGEENPTEYYTPLREDKTPANFLKAKPQCDLSRCNACGSCFSICPMDTIQNEMGKPIFNGICIKCQACRHICSQNAITFTDSDFLSHIAMLEKYHSSPQSSEFFF